MIYKFFDKKSSGGAITRGDKPPIASPIMSIKQLAEESHQPIIIKFKKQKVYSSSQNNFCGTDLEDLQLVKELNEGFQFSLCIVDIYSTYEWVIPLKNTKKSITITNAF